MADPFGNLLGRLLSGGIGYAIGARQEQARERAALLHDARKQAIVNRTYVRLYERLARAKVGQFRLVDLVGEATVAQFALDTAEYVKRQLREQP